MAVKKIDFEKSLEYFFKDKDYYQPRDCHVNAYVRFYDKNYEEVERRLSKFKYVTGFLAFEDEDGKKCIVHSWIEKDGCVIDTTPFANLYACKREDFSDEELRELKKLSIEKSKYVGVKGLSDIELTRKCRQIAASCVDIEKQYIAAVEKFITEIVESISNDEKLIIRQKEMGYELVTGDYSCFIH